MRTRCTSILSASSISCGRSAFTRSHSKSRVKRSRECPEEGDNQPMPGPLLYRPPPRWQFWAALGGAIAIHLASVGIAAINREPPLVDLTNIPTATVEAMLQPEDQPTPPPEDIPIPEPPPIPEVAPEFHEEKPPPPRPQTKPT